MNEEAFWKAKRLSDMNAQEWESLCDGCGQCCLYKLEDEDSDEMALTNVASPITTTAPPTCPIACS